MTCFVDTGYFVARIVAEDQWRDRALRAEPKQARLITSSLVINETVSLLQRRGLLSTALEFLREIRATPEVQIIYVDAGLQAEAWDLFNRWSGSGANAVDCTSFAIMGRFSIKRALTFDEHFRTAGFEISR